MNTQTLRKNYGKLTARERYSAILAAAERGDKDELVALRIRAKILFQHSPSLWNCDRV